LPVTTDCATRRDREPGGRDPAATAAERLDAVRARGPGRSKPWHDPRPRTRPYDPAQPDLDRQHRQGPDHRPDQPGRDRGAPPLRAGKVHAHFGCKLGTAEITGQPPDPPSRPARRGLAGYASAAER